VFNLSQSVLLVLWELVRARPGPAPAEPQPVPRATLAERQGLREDWEQALLDLGYGRQGRGTLHDRILRRLLELHERGGGERDDAAMLRGLARAIGVLRASRPPAP
jgi:tRNA C32,U32 (ribose-2'-O)-methylase TrmJ